MSITHQTLQVNWTRHKIKIATQDLLRLTLWQKLLYTWQELVLGYWFFNKIIATGAEADRHVFVDFTSGDKNDG